MNRLLRRKPALAIQALMAATILGGPAAAADFTVTNNNASGAGSYIDAVAAANASAGGDTISFAQPLAGGQTIALTAPGSTLTGSTVIGGSATPVVIGFTAFGNSNNVVSINASAPAVFRLGQGVTLQKGQSWGSAINVAATSAQTTVIIDGVARHVGNSYSYGVRSFAQDTDLVVNGTVFTSGLFAKSIDGIFRSIVVNGVVENTGDSANGSIYLAEYARSSTVVVASGGSILAPAGAVAIYLSLADDVLELQPGSTVQGFVSGNTGHDILRFGGAGAGTFDLADISPDNTFNHQYNDFEAFEKAGTSTWTLTGTTAVGFPITVNGGTLRVAGSIAGSPVTVNSGTMLVEGSMSGSSATVAGGLLRVDGALVGMPVTVNAGTLGGSGTVGATTVNSGGTLAPGAGIGTLTVNGNLTMGAGSTYAVEV